MSYDRQPPAPFLQRQHIRTLLIFIIALAIVWWENSKQAPQRPARPDNDAPSASFPAPEPNSSDSASPSEERPTTTGETSNLPDDSAPTPAEVTPDRLPKTKRTAEHTTNPTKGQATGKSEFLVENQSIRDLNGRVVFRGTVDLTPTIERIERGEANRHRNDGTNFQNREGRLPRKPSGYYKEYVHPTPGINGPGPQRIIIGKEGEIWYTPDHYNTFQQIHRKEE